MINQELVVDSQEFWPEHTHTRGHFEKCFDINKRYSPRNENKLRYNCQKLGTLILVTFPGQRGEYHFVESSVIER